MKLYEMDTKWPENTFSIIKGTSQLINEEGTSPKWDESAYKCYSINCFPVHRVGWIWSNEPGEQLPAWVRSFPAMTSTSSSHSNTSSFETLSRLCVSWICILFVRLVLLIVWYCVFLVLDTQYENIIKIKIINVVRYILRLCSPVNCYLIFI